MISNKITILFVLLLAVTVAFAVVMRLKPAADGFSDMTEIRQDVSTGPGNHQVKAATDNTAAFSTGGIGVEAETGTSKHGQSRPQLTADNSHHNLSYAKNPPSSVAEKSTGTLQVFEMEFEPFNSDMEYAVSARDYTAFADLGLMMQDSYLVNKPCVECRQLFVDMFTNPQADLEFRVLSMETLSGIANYENSQALISEFIKQLVSLNEPGSDPASAIVVDEIKNILLETGNDLNIKTLVDFYIGKTDILTDNPLLLMSAETRSLVEQEISTMLSEHYDRKLIATVLRDAFKENPTQHAQNQLIDLDYPELFVELALAAQQSGLTSQKDYFIDHIYQNLPPDDALRGMYGLSSRNLDTPENFYERTKRWAQRNIGRYTDAFDEIFSNYHNNADRSLKSVAIALAGNLYNESKARSILDRALGIESDPLIRKMIIDELYRLSDADQI